MREITPHEAFLLNSSLTMPKIGDMLGQVALYGMAWAGRLVDRLERYPALSLGGRMLEEYYALYLYGVLDAYGKYPEELALYLGLDPRCGGGSLKSRIDLFVEGGQAGVGASAIYKRIGRARDGLVMWLAGRTDQGKLPLGMAGQVLEAMGVRCAAGDGKPLPA